MDTTLTIRLPAAQRKALQRRAAAAKQSESALVRELIEREMQRGFDFERVRDLVGSVASAAKHWSKSPWRKQIRDRNWRS
jgi:predicted DNA-binding protein